ncbi:MAG: thiamine pyrophosphate-binding protein [Hyphomicrobiales bacterium]|nr:thiamine pyrophosphate-binding protein [Hyphomicrobiales bacterium]
MDKRTGGQILIDALINNGTDTIFGVPGESYLEALDAIYERQNNIRFITCRQEGGAAYMAEAWANATGKPGLCFVTRGPGVTNASVGLHTAFQGSTPMLLLIGQIPRHQMEREAFQEIDYRQMLGPVTKWVAQIDSAERIPEFINRAFAIAMNGRPGPVALALPEDMLLEYAKTEDLPPAIAVKTMPAKSDVAKVKEMLGKAKRPLIVLGGSNWDETGRNAIQEFAERNQIPVAAGFRRQDTFDNTHQCYIGNLGFGSFPQLLDYVVSSDLIIAIGSRMADATVRKYTLVEAPKPKQKLIHVLSAPEELGRVLTPDIAICCDTNRFAVAINENITVDNPVWAQLTFNLSKQHSSSLVLGPQAGPVDMGKVMEYLREKLPANAIITNGAGNYADWPNKMFTYRGARTTLAPVSGAMGYSVPAAAAAKLAFPDCIVLSFAGDGDFLMNGQEIATIAQYGVNPIILVINNGSYGTIRMHQEKRHPERVSGTDLKNPDFAAYARSFGINGHIVEHTDQFVSIFETALKSNIATLIEIRVGPDSFGPDTSISGLDFNRA